MVEFLSPKILENIVSATLHTPHNCYAYLRTIMQIIVSTMKNDLRPHRPPPLPLSAPGWRRRHHDCHGCRFVAAIVIVAIAAATAMAAAVSAPPPAPFPLLLLQQRQWWRRQWQQRRWRRWRQRWWWHVKSTLKGAETEVMAETAATTATVAEVTAAAAAIAAAATAATAAVAAAVASAEWCEAGGAGGAGGQGGQGGRGAGGQGGHRSRGSRGSVRESVELGWYDLYHNIYSSKDYLICLGPKI